MNQEIIQQTSIEDRVSLVRRLEEENYTNDTCPKPKKKFKPDFEVKERNFNSIQNQDWYTEFVPVEIKETKKKFDQTFLQVKKEIPREALELKTRFAETQDSLNTWINQLFPITTSKNREEIRQLVYAVSETELTFLGYMLAIAKWLEMESAIILADDKLLLLELDSQDDAILSNNIKKWETDQNNCLLNLVDTEEGTISQEQIFKKMFERMTELLNDMNILLENVKRIDK